MIRPTSHLRTLSARLRMALAALAALAVLWPGMALAVESYSGWWLAVRNAACAQGPKVLLGDIAEPRGDMPASKWAEMAARPLWAAPERTGHQMALSRDRLVALLRYHAEDLAPSCSLPAQLVIQRGGAVIDGTELSRRIDEYLTRQSAALGGELEIKDLHGPDFIFLANPRDELDITPSSPVRPGRLNLLLSVRGSQGKVIRRYAASAFLNVWKSVPCASGPLNRHETLDLARVQFKRKNLAYNENVWDGTGGPWRMVRSIGVDQAIRTTDIEPVPVIAKGDKVNLVYQGANLHLQVHVEALHDAGIGQSIQVRNLQSKRKITAVVQDAQTVVVR